MAKFIVDARVPWREREFISADDAAAIMARSPDWVRSCVDEGLLLGFRLRKGGPMVVLVASVIEFIGQAVRIAPKEPSREFVAHPGAARFGIDFD